VCLHDGPLKSLIIKTINVLVKRIRVNTTHVNVSGVQLFCYLTINLEYMLLSIQVL